MIDQQPTVVSLTDAAILKLQEPARSNPAESCSKSSCVLQAEAVGTKFWVASGHLTCGKVLHFRFEAAR